MTHSAHILLAVNDPDFASLIQLGFQEAGILNAIHVVHDGQDAIRYLDGDLKYADRAHFPLPALLLLDSRLKTVSGFEVLQWTRQQPGLDHIGIILFSSLGSPQDAQLARELRADYFMEKPFDFQELLTAVERVAGPRLLRIKFYPRVPADITRAIP
jgi:two-component system response regulator